MEVTKKFQRNNGRHVHKNAKSVQTIPSHKPPVPGVAESLKFCYVRRVIVR